MWLHRLAGAPAAPFIDNLLRDAGNRVYASAVAVAEIVSVLRRKGFGERVPRAVSLLRESARILVPSVQTYEDAGRIHAHERTVHRDFGLADALLLAQATEVGAVLVTTDRALVKNRQGVKVKVP